eukprot:scaffold72174_cov30-Cyclotella_meneghiniana.AAC.1
MVYEKHVRGFKKHGYGDGDVLIALQAIFRANIMLYQRGKYVSPHCSDNHNLDNTIDLMYVGNHYEAVESSEGMSKRSTDLRNKKAKRRLRKALSNIAQLPPPGELDSNSANEITPSPERH